MKKSNIILSIFNVILSIALIVMILLYFNAVKMSKNNLESQLTAANEVFELNKKVQELEEELEIYKKSSSISTVTNSTTSNKVVSTEPYVPDGVKVTEPNDNPGVQASDMEFNRSPENVTIKVVPNTACDTSVQILIKQSSYRMWK